MKRVLYFFLSVLMTGVSYASSENPFYQYNSGDFFQARDKMISLAKSNNKEALFYLARMYFNGFGLEKNFNKGLALMQQSAKLGYLPALLYLGNYYFFDKKSVAEALPWFKAAAKKDNTNAQLFVTLAYVYGYGAKRNIDNARWSMIQAAKKGNPMAQYELGIMFLASKHKSSHYLGEIWLRKSASQNYTKAIELLKQPDIKKAIKQIEDDSTLKLSKLAEYELMKKALTEARSTLQDKDFISLNNGQQLSTPKLMTVTKNMIIQPDYNLLNPTSIPIQKISAIILRDNYVKQKPTLAIPEQPFTLPLGAKNYEAAYTQLKERSIFGDPMVLYRLGQMYAQGLYVKKNEKKAFEYFYESALQNYVHAQYEVGVYFLQGKAVPTDTKEAIIWLTKAALRGSPEAQFVLGNIYEFGINKPGEKGYIFRDVYQSKALYNISALRNIPESQYRLAQLFASGMLNPNNDFSVERKNLRKAYALYQKAAKKGIKEANLGLAFLEAAYGNSSDKLKKLFKSIEVSAVEGNPNSLLLIALLYDHGKGVDQDQGEAINIYENLSKQGNPVAQFMLGTYEYTRADNKEKAIYWLKKSADQNNPYAQYNLALLIHKKIYNSVDETFEGLLKKSANNHFSKADLLLADHYLLENKDESSIKQAVEIYQALAAKQNAIAQLKLGYMHAHGIYFKKNESKAFEYYLQAANNENPTAQYLTARMYQMGKGTDRNLKKAIQYFTLSANSNYLPALIALGFCNEIYLGNYKNALSLYEKASQLKSPIAQYNLGLMYEYGKAAKRNTETAYTYFKDSATQLYAPAEVKLGKIYLSGKGASKDPAEAFKWFKKAAQQNNPTALYQLGLMYESGVGTEVNIENAKAYYDKAAKLGVTQAQVALARLNKDNTKAEISYYKQTSTLDIPFVKYRLSLLKNNNSTSSLKEKDRFCINSITETKKSLLGKMGTLFADTPHQAYMNAVNSLNHCEIIQGITALQQIIKDRPDYLAAKETLNYYLCPTDRQEQVTHDKNK